jgi:hypothetical protein
VNGARRSPFSCARLQHRRHRRLAGRRRPDARLGRGSGSFTASSRSLWRRNMRQAHFRTSSPAEFAATPITPIYIRRSVFPRGRSHSYKSRLWQCANGPTISGSCGGAPRTVTALMPKPSCRPWVWLGWPPRPFCASGRAVRALPDHAVQGRVPVVSSVFELLGSAAGTVAGTVAPTNPRLGNGARAMSGPARLSRRHPHGQPASWPALSESALPGELT